MIHKNPILAERIRRTPEQFSWVDHRLVRDRFIDSCTHAGAALYLFLLTVADNQGLSYYSDPSIMARLSMDETDLEEARQNLIHIGLIAYRKPLYQVLAMPAPVDYAKKDRPAMKAPVPIGQILKKIAEAAS